jgi:hypothetical protein
MAGQDQYETVLSKLDLFNKAISNVSQIQNEYNNECRQKNKLIKTIKSID